METTWTSLTKDIKPLLQTEIQFIILLSFDKKKKKKKKKSALQLLLLVFQRKLKMKFMFKS